MSTIISGRFNEMAQARKALQQFFEHGFEPYEYACYAASTPGRQGLFNMDGEAAEAARAAAGGAIGGAIGGATGLAVGSLGGPLGAAAGAAVGAYVGSLAGTMSQPGQNASKPAEEDIPADNGEGPMVAVCADRPGTEAAAIAILSAAGAQEIERSNGSWRDGGWADYDPAKPTEVLLKASPAAADPPAAPEEH